MLELQLLTALCFGVGHLRIINDTIYRPNTFKVTRFLISASVVMDVIHCEIQTPCPVKY
jgi:hypothetical protein